MMGKIIEDLEQSVTKTTKGLVVLPRDHPKLWLRRIRWNGSSNWLGCPASNAATVRIYAPEIF